MWTLRRNDVIAVLSAGLLLATVLINSAFFGSSSLRADERLAEPVLDHPAVIPASTATSGVASPELRYLERLYQLSLNWADYAEMAQPKVAAPQLRYLEHIRQASMNWADYAQAVETASPGSSTEITRIGRPF
jgi:hypothetical protein